MSDSNSIDESIVSEIEDELIGETNSVSQYDGSPRTTGDNDEYSYSFDEDEDFEEYDKKETIRPKSILSNKSSFGNNDNNNNNNNNNKNNYYSSGGGSSNSGFQNRKLELRRSTSSSSTNSNNSNDNSPTVRFGANNKTNNNYNNYNYNTNTNNTIKNNNYKNKVEEISSSRKQLMLEEISNEVVQLRNQQREVLRVRLQMAKEKKQRAGSRRKAYEDEMLKLENRCNESLESKRQSEMKIDMLEKKVESMESVVSDLRKNLEKSMDREESLSKDLSNATSTISALRQELQESKAIHAKEIADIEKKCSNLEVDSRISEQKVLLMEKNCEEVQKSFERERENLPEYHSKILEERMLALKMREDEIENRTKNLKEEEIRKMNAIEELRKDMIAMNEKNIKLADENLNEEKKQLEMRKKEVEDERLRVLDTFSRDKMSIDALKVQLASKENSLKEMETRLKQDQMVYESNLRMVEPKLNAVRETVERSRIDKEKAEKIIKNAEDYAASVLTAENNLRVQEKSYNSAREKMFQDESALNLHSRNLQLMQRTLEAKHEKINEERFRLHHTAVELSNQFLTLKQVMRVLSSHSRKAVGMKSSFLDTTGMGSSSGSSDNSGSRDHSPGAYDDSMEHTGTGSRFQETSMMSERSHQTQGVPPQDILITLASKVDIACDRISSMVQQISSQGSGLPSNEAAMPSINKEFTSQSRHSFGEPLQFNKKFDPQLAATFFSVPATKTELDMKQKVNSRSQVPPPPPPSTSAGLSEMDEKTFASKDMDLHAYGSLTSSLKLTTESVSALKSAATKYGYYRS